MLRHTEEAGPTISELDLKRFERDANLILPVDYRTFLLKHNGGRPVPADFILALGGEMLQWRVHFFFGLNDSVESCCLRWNLNITKETRPAGTLPIADDEGGNMLYLRWDKPDAGSIHFGPTPSDGRGVRLVRICASFNEFLGLLHEARE